ncbi:Endonuclease/exonuclease/phosphatase [Mrakia frigida]|uniref:Endonuclease/exonuclease/phosphatase n=1 Tax=Mrakia frigida TaxID=29902 RepID=UPI003FCC1652
MSSSSTPLSSSTSTPPIAPGSKPPKGSKLSPQLTPEQEAKKLARAVAKALAAASAPGGGANGGGPIKRSKEQLEMGKFLTREWVNVGDGETGEGRKVKIGSWNMLAQTLVRRELFPGSDCLKWSDRQQMLISELSSFQTDILCLQEVDRLSFMLPHLPAYSHVEAKGRGKAHGLVILYRSSMFAKVGEEKVIVLDEQEVRGDGEAKRRRGGTRETKNIGLMVALERKEGGGGVIALTTHLFWHPLYTYERARQLGILLREVVRFRESLGKGDWPCVMAGDFNSQPIEPSYSLLTSTPPTASQLSNLVNSAQIHKSTVHICSHVPSPPQGIPEFIPPDAVAPTVPEDDDDEGEGEGEGEGGGEGMKDTTRPTEEDGILSFEELKELYAVGGGEVKSLYDEAWRMGEREKEEGRTFGGRLEGEGLERDGKGWGEPNWTSYTPLWHLTLDYIFLLPPTPLSGQPAPKITAYLRPHRTEDLAPGLPMKGKCASDHVAVCGEIRF